MNSYAFVNGVKIYKFRVKDFEINAASLRLGNVSKQLILQKRLDYIDMLMVLQLIVLV